MGARSGSPPRVSRLARALGWAGRALQRVPRGAAPLLVLLWGAVIWGASSIEPPKIGHGQPSGAILGN